MILTTTDDAPRNYVKSVTMQVQGLSQHNVPMEFTALYMYYSAIT